MFDFEIVDIDNPKWNDLISNCYTYDFYHTSCYHKIEEQANETSGLFVASSGTEFICLPLIVKPIPNTDFFDATSVYGYCGPVASKPFKELQPELIKFFKSKFVKYCNQNNIVSVFSRLHSLIPQINLFKDFGEVIDLNKTVAIDLTLSLDEQRRAFRKSTKSEINQLKGKKGYVFQNVDNRDDESIHEFVNIYHDTMKRVEAKPYYFFDFDYFKQLLNNSCFECDLLIAKKNDEMAAGAIFTRTNSIMQYHLAGTKDTYMKDTPMKLIIDEARKVGVDKGLRHLHLGGGVGGSDDDPLFRFKSGFSKNFKQFSVWRYIVCEKTYLYLVNKRFNHQIPVSSFFPLYRLNL